MKRNHNINAITEACRQTRYCKERLQSIRSRSRWAQTTLNKEISMSNICNHDNITSTWDSMIPCKEGDGIYSQIFQNIRGTHNNDFEATYKNEAIDKLSEISRDKQAMDSSKQAQL